LRQLAGQDCKFLAFMYSFLQSFLSIHTIHPGNLILMLWQLVAHLSKAVVRTIWLIFCRTLLLLLAHRHIKIC
jgi:hypothetical protein